MSESAEQANTRSSSKNNRPIFERFLTVAIVVLSAALVAIMISVGALLMRTQFRTPIMGLPSVISAGASLIVVILTVTLGIVLIYRGISHITCYDSQYCTSLLGTGGLGGIALSTTVTLCKSLFSISLPLIPPLPDAIAAYSLVIIPIGLFCYDLHRLDSIPIPPEQRDHDLDPETVRDRTAGWSDDAHPKLNINRNQPSENDIHSIGDDLSASSDPYTEGHRRLDREDTTFNWQSETDVTFEDVGGMDNLKKELYIEVVKPLEEQEKAEELGVSAPNIVFHGPPGTGKTYMAQALASKLDLPFTQLSGADLQSKWINESAEKVNQLFAEASQIADRKGGAVVFLDEIDTVLQERTGRNSHNEDKKVVNEFLTQLENTKDHDILFVGATNRLDALDKAGIRSGRIDKKIRISKPDTDARADILRAQLRNRRHAISDKQIQAFGQKTEGVVAADIAVAVENAAKRVLARDDERIRTEDLHVALAKLETNTG